MAKRRRKPRKPKTKRKREPNYHKRFNRARLKRDADRQPLRVLIREASRVGATEAIEHCANFWSVSDGYKKYIDYQIASEAEALLAAVKNAVRSELMTVQVHPRKRKR